MMFKNIDEALEWIMSRRNEAHDFDTFKNIMHTLGNPQDAFKTVHVAGTNGKGSTVTFLRDLFMIHGYKVGTLQSPHFITHLDRIRLNGENIDADFFLDTLNEYYDFFVEHNLNMFEMDFVIMCFYFIKRHVDIAIIEVGLGGRLDSTNVLKKPLLSIITTIGFDHMDRLGNSLEEICKEKCGIIKKDSAVLLGDLKTDLKVLCKEIATDRGASYHEMKTIEILKDQRFIYDDEIYRIKSLAHYQIHNAALALEAYKILGFRYDEQLVKKALASSLWRGRFEVIAHDPLVIIDGAHNVEGIMALMDSVKELKGSKALLFGALKRKEFMKMLKVVESNVDKLVLTSFNHPEACKAQDYPDFEYFEDYQIAYKKLLKEYDNIIVAGSLYFISQFVQDKNN